MSKIKKTNWKELLQIIANIITILSVVSVIIGLLLYVKRPNLTMEINCPTPNLEGKVYLDFQNGLSNPLECEIILSNKGSKEANRPIASILFNRRAEINNLIKENWAEKSTFAGKELFFEDRTLIIHQNNKRSVGTFSITIPQQEQNEERFILAIFNLRTEGAKLKSGAILYDYNQNKLITDYSLNEQSLINHLTKGDFGFSGY